MNDYQSQYSTLKLNKRPTTSSITSKSNYLNTPFSPYKEVITCLNINPQRSNNNIQDLVDQTKYSSKQTFLSNINQRNIVKVKDQFITKLTEMNSAAEQIIIKENNQCKECQLKINKYKELNEALQDTIQSINNKYKQYENELKQSNEEINRLQLRFGQSEKVKPLFEALVKAFPEDDPLQLVTDIIGKQDKNISMLTSINTLKEKYGSVEREMEEDSNKVDKIMEDLNKKIIEIDLDSKSKTSKYKKDLLTFTKDLEAYLVYKKNNVGLKDILFKSYVLLIERLKCERAINIDEYFYKVTMENFNPELFDNRTLIGYINQLLGMYEKDNTILMLRKTIAYANMMLRIYLSDKKHLRYDPLKTLIEIKAFNDQTEFEISKLNSINTTLTVEDKKNQKIINELKRELKLRELKYDSLKRKIARQSQGNKDDSYGIGINGTGIDMDGNRKRKAATAYNKKKRFFLTDTLGGRKGNNDNEDKKAMLELLKPRSANVSETNIYELSHEDSSDSSKFANSFSAKETDIKKFRDIKLSKNKDKLIKSNGYRGMEGFLLGLKNLVDKTNRIEYYQNRIETSMNKLTLSNQFPSVSGLSQSDFNKILTSQDMSKGKGKGNNKNKEPEMKDKYEMLSQKVIHKLSNMIMSTRNTTDNNI